MVNDHLSLQVGGMEQRQEERGGVEEGRRKAVSLGEKERSVFCCSFF